MPEELFASRAFEHGWDPLEEEEHSELSAERQEDNLCRLSPVLTVRVRRLSEFRFLVGIPRAAKQGGKQCSGMSKCGRLRGYRLKHFSLAKGTVIAYNCRQIHKEGER
jgi:hypothetical protein